MADKLRLLVCEKLSGEAAALMTTSNREDLALIAFPAGCARDEEEYRAFWRQLTVEQGDIVALVHGQDCAVPAKLPDGTKLRVHTIEPCSYLHPSVVAAQLFRLTLSNALLESRLEREKGRSAKLLTEENRRLAGYAMAVDLMGRLNRTMTEAEAVGRIRELFDSLFAPQTVTYIPWPKDRADQAAKTALAAPPTEPSPPEGIERSGWADATNGFWLRITHQGDTLGLLKIEGISFPEHREQYLSLALSVAEVCGLAIADARKYEALKRIGELLAEERERLAVTLHSIGDGVIATDTEARVVLLNEVAERLTGWTQREAIGEDLSKVFHIVDASTRQPCGNPVVKALATGKVVDLANNTALISRDGSERMIADSAAPIRDAAGRVLGVVLVFRDVTDRKRAERFRDQYIHTIGHDLRNPLTSISGTAQLLQLKLQERGLERERRYAENIIASTARMNSMVLDLVESARLESGQLELALEPVDLCRLVADVVERFGVPEHRQRMLIDLPKPACEPLLRVEADPERLQRAIVNLLSNALKYSPADRPVTIRLSHSNGKAEVAVVDRGSGIAPEELPHLFSPYYRGESSGQVEGLGLGLYVTRLIAEAHGGGVSGESEVGKGSKFSLWLPTK